MQHKNKLSIDDIVTLLEPYEHPKQVPLEIISKITDDKEFFDDNFSAMKEGYASIEDFQSRQLMYMFDGQEQYQDFIDAQNWD